MMIKQHQCPCCDEITITVRGNYEICQICNWEDDPGQSQHPDDELGANTICLNHYRTEWRRLNQKNKHVLQPA